MQLILISGLSGSGKSIALNVLEDSGFYCVDNLPAKLLPDVTHFLQEAGYSRVAASIDVRSGATLNQLPRHVAELKRQGIDVRLLFLEAKNETLMKRFSETRRRHPLNDDTHTLSESIQLEREKLADIGDLAQHIDTSDLNPNALRGWIKDLININRSSLTLLFQSFGFKNGIPLDADMVFDVRCLPNPHYDPALRELTGNDAAVIEYLQNNKDVRGLLADIRLFIENWLPCYARDNRDHLTIAFGCTGGRHRSVYFAETLAEHFRPKNQVLVRHREL
ncbi:MAG TPA: RNase adapter RapZ [Burkholderiales bacterium]|nr:RNase adapter RapZ [Burkholderiales bacterium]